jgi:hypothetical protein
MVRNQICDECKKEIKDTKTHKSFRCSKCEDFFCYTCALYHLCAKSPKDIILEEIDEVEGEGVEI